MSQRMATLVAVTILAGAAAAGDHWTEHKGFNCWTGSGATGIDTFPIGTMSLKDCQAKCDDSYETSGCTAVTLMMKGPQGNCWRRKNVDVTNCKTGTKFDTWVKVGPFPAPSPPPPAPAMPSSEFPTTVPAFMKAFVEGLLSDKGTDAKRCEGDAAAFASAMEKLAQTAVRSTKAVAAAIESAKEKCTPVAKDALKLAASMLGDVFHPGRIAQNFQATRSDVLTEIGNALEALAQKDFRGAGDNAGRFTRRLIEGAQDANSLTGTSTYTKMGDVNCYNDHGATDLEKEAGKPCGEMTVDECEQKCDEISECQAITASRTSGDKVLCYRRGSLNLGQCDHQAAEYATFLNSKAHSPQTSNTVASIAAYVVTYWGAAAMTQPSLASESPKDWGNFLEGLLEGLMSDGSDFSDCQSAIPVVGQAVKKAKEMMGEKLAATAAAAKIAKQSCGTLGRDVERLAKAAFYDLKHPDQVVQNFHDEQYDLLMDVGQAFTSLAKNDYSSAGDFMGMAIRRLIEGKQTTVIV